MRSIHGGVVTIRSATAVVLLVLVGTVWGSAQSRRWRATDDIPRYERYLREALPEADSFRFIDRGTPHYRGYRTGANGEETLVGLGFFTVDFTPDVRGYKGEIWMLIGMNPGGTLIDISMVYHSEPFGYFSIDLLKALVGFDNLAQIGVMLGESAIKASVLDNLRFGDLFVQLGEFGLDIFEPRDDGGVHGKLRSAISGGGQAPRGKSPTG